MQLLLYPYRGWILAQGMGLANAAVISAAILGICCRHQSSYEDQTQHLESARVQLHWARLQIPRRCSNFLFLIRCYTAHVGVG